MKNLPIRLHFRTVGVAEAFGFKRYETVFCEIVLSYWDELGEDAIFLIESLISTGAKRGHGASDPLRSAMAFP
jgi:hypothetical protein